MAQLPRTSHENGRPEAWSSFFLTDDTIDYTYPDNLAPLDPRTQDPNIAPWADMPPSEEYDTENTPAPIPANKRLFSSKGSSFSLAPSGIFGNRQIQHRGSDGPESIVSTNSDGKKSATGSFFKGLRRKNSKPSLQKEVTFNIPEQPVPPIPNVVISGARSPPSPPVRKFRKPSKNKAPPPLPPKDNENEIFLDTNFESLDGIVDSTRIGQEPRGSMSHDPPVHSNWEEGPYRPTGGSTSAIWNETPVISIAPQFNGSATFTNPFAAEKKRPQPLRIKTESPKSTQKSLPFLPPSAHSGGPLGPHATSISPTDLGVNDPTSPSWVAPESWGVKRLDEDDESGSLSDDDSNLKLQEPTRNGPKLADEDDHSVHDHHGLHSGSSIEYKIRVFSEPEGQSFVFTIPYTETAQSFITTKYSLMARREVECRLWIRDRGRDRMLGGTERILPLLRKRLEAAGYDDDELPTIVGEDLGHIFNLIVRDVTWRAESEEPTNVVNPNFIDFTGMALTKIPILLHRMAPHIVLLNLSRNVGIDLPSDFIQSCEALRELRLAGVGLRKVPPAIKHSVHLARLDVSSNRITDLDDSGLDSIPSLRSLKLQCNRLTTLPNYFASMHSIKDLNISNNKFDGFPNVLFSMTSLQDLDISYNNIRAFPPTIGKLTGLQRLTIIGNQLTAFVPEFSALVDLEVLDCRRNMITDISLISNLPKLKNIHAQHNAIHVLDIAVGPGLNILKAPHNQITRLRVLETPHALQLMHLDLSYTKLSSIDEDVIAALTSLNTLRLDHNHFRTLPVSLCSLTYLQHLSCSNNVLDELPQDIGYLENLQILDVHSNSLHQIPASIWQCGSLTLFNATSNLIDVWRSPPSTQSQSAGSQGSGRAAFGSLTDIHNTGSTSLPVTTSPEQERRPSQSNLLNGRPNRRQFPLEGSLQKLYLSDNLLKDDGLYFLSRLPTLRVLNISFNDIQDLPTTWLQRLPLLEELYLSGNKLSVLPVDGLQALTKLHTLYLNGNKLQTLPSALNKIPSLTVLDVGSNILRYNINNWHFDWNWNFNRNLKYLNLSGNTRLEIRPEATKRSHFLDKPEGPVLHEFSALSQLKVLGLMDVTTGFISIIPDDNEERRVRTSGSEVNGMGYGIADSMGKLNQLTMFDIVVPSFRMHENECLFGMFGRPEPTHNSTRLSKFIQEHFTSELIIKLNSLRPELDEGVEHAFRRAFLSMNRQLYKYLTNSVLGQFSRKMSAASASTNSTIGPGGDPAILKTGAAAIVIYIKDKTMYVANAGNSLAVVSRNGTAHLVSQRHDPLDRNELGRIRGSEGWISQKELLNDELDVSRSFGMYHLLPSVSARPAVRAWEITDQDEFVIIGNCYLWDFVPYQNAVDIARQCKDPMAAAQKLRDMAISYGADSSIMIMVLSVADLFPAKAVQRKNALETGEFGGFKNPLRGNNEPISSKMLNRLPDEVDAPVGTVALVFTDIANSTHLWEKNAGMRTAMLMHNDLLKRQLLTIGGYLVKTEGDAFMCSFPTVVSALLWCLTAQISLVNLDWPLEILESQDGREVYDADGTLLARGLSVRMGLHWGAPLCEPDFITHRMDYFGPMVNRSARICGSAKGGQLMISNDVLRELSQHFPLDENTPPPAPPKTTEAISSNPAAVRERDHIDALRRMGFSITSVGEKKLKGIEALEALSLVWPKELEGRTSLMHEKSPEEVSAAAADANSRVPFSIDQMKQLALLCIRLETLTSGRVFKTASSHKPPAAAFNQQPSLQTLQLTNMLDENQGGPIDIIPEIDAPLGFSTTVEDFTDPVYLMANPELLMPSIKEGVSDDYLMLLLDSLSVRIDNALAALHLKQMGGYRALRAKSIAW